MAPVLALVLLAGLLGCTGATATRQVAAPPTITGHWQAAPYLAQELAAPVIAPSNPRVAYELPAPSDNGVAHGFQRTDDGGATWHALPTPLLPGPLMDAAIRVSPVDARNVFLQVDFGVPLTGSGVPTLNCPAALASTTRPNGSAFLLAPGSNDGNCPALFYSTNGGDSWAPARLALPGELVYANSMWPIADAAVPQAQGERLYAAMRPGPTDSTPIGVRLMVSADQGATWQLADGTLFSQAPAICDAIAAQQGTSLFALTADANCFDASDTTRTLWRSDDNGATWIQEGALPETAQALLAASDGAPQPVLYAASLGQSGTPTLSGIQVSANGGHTWQPAPQVGAPTTLGVLQIAGLLSDGSMVAAMQPSAATTPSATQAPATTTLMLYALKAGAASWRQLSPPSPPLGQPGEFVVAPSGDSPLGAIWVVGLTGDFQQPGAIYTTDTLILS